MILWSSKTLKKETAMNKKYTYVDLFAGVGGLSLGFDRAGFKNIFAIEYDNVFATNYSSNLKNHKVSERKYNQRDYLFNLCGKLTDIYTKNNLISLNPDLIIDKEEQVRVGRNPYLQRLYKLELINEQKLLYNSPIAKCVLEHLGYPILIASHIKPYRNCTPEEQFDKNNGLLLSKNIDSLFDNGYITFDDSGNIITSSKLDSDVATYIKQFKLDSVILNSKRKEYMEYHRQNVFMRS